LIPTRDRRGSRNASSARYDAAADVSRRRNEFNAIDRATRETISATLTELGAAGRTLLVATHDLENVDARFDGVFELRDGKFELRDSDGNVITARRRLLAQLTVKDGRVWYERPAEH